MDMKPRVLPTRNRLPAVGNLLHWLNQENPRKEYLIKGKMGMTNRVTLVSDRRLSLPDCLCERCKC